MTEDFICPTCKKKSKYVHACAEKIEKLRMSLDEIKELKYFCINCGRVSPIEDNLCHPVALDESDKAKFIIAAIGSESADVCKECGQPVSKPGHICDPKLPYTCEYCGEEVKNYRHMCSNMVKRAKYTCKNCGRISPDADRLCAPQELK